MGHWLLLVQIGVGGFGALLFLSAVAEAFSREEDLFVARKAVWDRRQTGDEREDEVYHADPLPDVTTMPGAS